MPNSQTTKLQTKSGLNANTKPVEQKTKKTKNISKTRQGVNFDKISKKSVIFGFCDFLVFF
jgi:hypothetical protein